MLTWYHGQQPIPSAAYSRRQAPALTDVAAVARVDHMFNYDWFHGSSFDEQQAEAKSRCVAAHLPKVDSEDKEAEQERDKFRSELELRTLIYLRDGFSYEVKQIADVNSRSHLVFECEPVDDHYKVGAFVVTVPFEEIVRVEVYAVHSTQRPEDLPQIAGFRAHHDGPEHKFPEGAPTRPGW